MLLHVTLHVRRDALDTFREFEHEAARILRKHGGELERVLVMRTVESEPYREVHVMSFPSEDAYEAYRVSPELAAFLPMRERSVVKTELCKVEEGSRYRG
jgi:uncharacterized protein (DUF1330 family)